MRTARLTLLMIVAAVVLIAVPALAESDFVVDGADVAVYPGDPAPLRFRIQNNTLLDTEFDWTIASGFGVLMGTVLVPSLKDTLIDETFAGSLVPGDFTFTLTLTPVIAGPVIVADQLVAVRPPISYPSAVSDESDVIVDAPLQKPITIVTPAGPAPYPGVPAERDKQAHANAALAPLPFTVTIANPDPLATPSALFDVTPLTGVITGGLATTVVVPLTISLPPGGLPLGTMNTITFNILVEGDTVHASGQAIFQGSCGVSEPECPPTFISSRWSQSTYDDYTVSGETRSLWCGSLNPPGYSGGTGYGACWDAPAYLRLGTRTTFQAAQGMTLGGVQLYSTEKAHDLCTISLGVGVIADTITNWREVARYSGISNPDSIGCVDWATEPHLCARYEPFSVIVAGANVPDNTSVPLVVRFRFRSDLTKSDQSPLPALDTKGAWRIDHLSIAGDLTPVNSYYPPDPSRTIVQRFEAPLPAGVWFFPPTTIYDCTAVTDPDATPSSASPSAAPRILMAQPNPARSQTRLRFSVPASGDAQLAIYDVGGRLVRELALGPLAPGVHEATWDGAARDGTPVASGVYFARLTAGEQSHALRVSIVRK
ncbi:MAG: FlgD immunoglobulin-like domain containing protein [bacterium]